MISHVPLNKLFESNHFTHDNNVVDIRTKILLTIEPDVVISGHVHREMYTQHRLDNKEVYEITVPTCSYRMGKRNMGIGSAVISKFEILIVVYIIINYFQVRVEIWRIK